MRKKLKFDNKVGVYALIDRVNNEFKYIGSGDLESRESNHISLLRHGKHKNKSIQSLFNEIDERNLQLEVIEYCDEEDSLKKEKYYKNLLKDTILNIKDIIKTEKKIRTPEEKEAISQMFRELFSGEKNPNCCKLSNQLAGEVLWIKQNLNLKHSEIAEMYNISTSMVSRIGKQRWKDVKPVVPYSYNVKEIKKSKKNEIMDIFEFINRASM